MNFRTSSDTNIRYIWLIPGSENRPQRWSLYSLLVVLEGKRPGLLVVLQGNGPAWGCRGRCPHQKINILRYEKFCTRMIEFIERYTIKLFLFHSNSKLSFYCKQPIERVPLDRNRFLEVHNLFFALIYISQCFGKVSNRSYHQNVLTSLYMVIAENSPVTGP